MRIAISQRVDEVAQRGERRDALDQRWAPLLEAAGLTAVPLPNGMSDPQAWAVALGIEGLLLSGGNDVGERPERDRSETRLIMLAEQLAWPVMGVCRGLQLMNLHLGGRLRPVDGHVAVRHTVRRTGGEAQFLEELPAMLEVNSFHNHGIAGDDLAPAMQSVMVDAHGRVEAAVHRWLPWVGVMWHPEREEVESAGDLALVSRLFRR